jgi:hypothetical protein
MSLSATALPIGAAASFSVSGAQPAEAVYFYRSRKPIVMGAGWTTPAFGATVLDLQAPVGLLGAAVADANGAAVLSVSVPLGAPAMQWMAFQAVALRSPDAAASNAVYAQVQ